MWSTVVVVEGAAGIPELKNSVIEYTASLHEMYGSWNIRTGKSVGRTLHDQKLASNIAGCAVLLVKMYRKVYLRYG